MTKDEALKMCLEYIETDAHERKYVRHAIKEALAQQEQTPYITMPPSTPMWTIPPQRTWAGLTNQERSECWETVPELAMKKVEAKLKEKNT